MVNELVPIEVDPNSAGRDFWRRYHVYRRERQEESRPGDPVRPDGIEEAGMRAGRKFEFAHRYEVHRDGQMLSWFEGSGLQADDPGYEQNRRFMTAYWSVHRDHRRQGLGRAWLPLLLELMDRHGRTVVTISTDEEPGHAFLRWMGAHAKNGDAESRLQLDQVAWAMVSRWIEDGPRRSPSTRLEIYDGRIPESMWDEYSAELSRLLNTIPFGQLDHGEIVVTRAHMRDWYERIDAFQETTHTVVAREPDGSMSGMTDVSWSPHLPAVIDQRFTGVRPDARGRGIGKWIKAAMLEHVRTLHPAARWVSTWNAVSNEPMLAINHRLGFRRCREGADYQISRGELAARIGSWLDAPAAEAACEQRHADDDQ